MTGVQVSTRGNKQKGRPFVGVYFKCCRQYVRAYLNRKGNAYVVWCPRCAAKMIINVSPYGSESTFFEAY